MEREQTSKRLNTNESKIIKGIHLHFAEDVLSALEDPEVKNAMRKFRLQNSNISAEVLLKKFTF